MIRPCFCDRLPPSGEPYTTAYCRLCWLYHQYKSDPDFEWADKGGLGDWLWAACDRLMPWLRGRKCGCNRRRRWLNSLWRSCSLWADG